MKIRLISELGELADCQSEWDSVACKYPFFRFSWVKNWVQHLGQDYRLAVLIGVDDDGKWRGIAPFCVDAKGAFASKLRFLGSGDACSDYLNLICPPDDYPEFSRLVVDWLLANLGNPKTLGSVDVIELEGITPTDEAVCSLNELMTASGLSSHQSDLEGGWVVDLPDTWSELNSRFSKSMRRKTKKASQRLANPSTQIISSDDVSFDELWPVFTQLHQQRREMLGQAGCFADPGFEKFLQQATRELVEQGLAELIFIDFERSPLATMLLFNDEESVLMYQSGMDVNRLDLEPGYQIAYCAIERSIQKKFRRFDFLRGDEPYKARWNTTRIPIVRTRYIPKHPVAKVKHGLWLTGRSIKNYMSTMSTPVD